MNFQLDVSKKKPLDKTMQLVWNQREHSVNDSELPKSEMTSRLS